MKRICLVTLFLGSFSFSVFSQTHPAPVPVPSPVPPAAAETAFDTAPEVIKQVPPLYPASMLEGGWEAMVYIKAYIGLDGSVQEAQAEKIQIKSIRTETDEVARPERTSEGKEFVEAAIKAVYQWKFTPAQIQKKPVSAWITIPFKFKLEESGKKAAGREKGNAEMDKATEYIQTNIENILTGSNPAQSRQFVDKNALLIINKETLNLTRVLNGEHKNIHFREQRDKTQMKKNMNIKFPNDQSAIVLWTSSSAKAKNDRVHSITLIKTPSNEWKVIHWHVSY